MDMAEYDALPEIDDIDMRLQDFWYQVRIDQPEDAWVKRTLQRAAPGLRGKEKAHLATELEAVWENFAAIGDPDSTYLVRVPDEPQLVVCWLRYRINYALEETSELFSPENYEADARVPDSEPGAHVEVISVWRQDVPSGVSVGQYATVRYNNLVTGALRVEERVSVAVFPTGAGQMLEFVFTTPHVGANTDHLVSLVQESMQSLTVKLAQNASAADAG